MRKKAQKVEYMQMCLGIWLEKYFVSIILQNTDRHRCFLVSENGTFPGAIPPPQTVHCSYSSLLLPLVVVSSGSLRFLGTLRLHLQEASRAFQRCSRLPGPVPQLADILFWQAFRSLLLSAFFPVWPGHLCGCSHPQEFSIPVMTSHLPNDFSSPSVTWAPATRSRSPSKADIPKPICSAGSRVEKS